MSLTHKARVRRFASFVIITAILSFLLIAHADETPELYELVSDINDKFFDVQVRLDDMGFQLNIILQGVELIAGVVLVGFGSVMGFLSIREVLRIWRS